MSLPFLPGNTFEKSVGIMNTLQLFQYYILYNITYYNTIYIVCSNNYLTI